MSLMLYIAALRQAGVILLVTCLTSFAVAAGSECLDYYKEPLYHPFAVPNSHSNRSFEIWLDAGIPDSPELNQVLKQRSAEITTMLERLSQLNLPILDKHIAFILKPVDKEIAIEGPLETSYTVKSHSMQLMGKNILVKVKGNSYIPSLKSAKNSRVIVLPIGPKGEGLTPSAIAHEIGHISQKDYDSDWNRSPYLLWNETRSDLISYLITDSTSHTFDKEFFINKMDLLGVMNAVQTHIVRNWAVPNIAHTSQLRPSIEKAYHENSELLTHILWSLSLKFGKSILVDFINWIDTVDLNRRLSKSNIRDSSNPTQIEYLRNIVQSRQKEMGSLIRKWANNKNRFSRRELAAINTLLENAGM